MKSLKSNPKVTSIEESMLGVITLNMQKEFPEIKPKVISEIIQFFLEDDNFSTLWFLKRIGEDLFKMGID